MSTPLTLFHCPLTLFHCPVCSQVFAAALPWPTSHVGCPITLVFLMSGTRGLLGLTDIKNIRWPALAPLEFDARTTDGTQAVDVALLHWMKKL